MGKDGLFMSIDMSDFLKKFKMRDIHKIVTTAVIFMIFGCWGGQGLASSSDIFYLRVPVGIDKKRAVAILARSKGLPQGQPVEIDKMEKFRGWAKGMRIYILQLMEILDDLPRLQGNAREERYRQLKERFNKIGVELYAFEDIGLGEKETIGIAHTLKKHLRIIFAIKGPLSDVIDFPGDISSSSVFEDMKSHLSAIEFDTRRFMIFEQIVIIGEPTFGSEGYLVDFVASQKISKADSEQAHSAKTPS